MLDPTIIRLALPIILANASTPLVGLVDTAMLGFAPSPDYLAALAIGTTVLNLVYWSFGYLKMALTGIVAQARGREDEETISSTFYRSLRTAMFISIALIIALPLINMASLWLLGSTDSVNNLAKTYINIRMLSAPAIMGNLVLAGLLFGLAQPNKIFIIYGVLNSTNILLDLFFVKGLGMHIDGVAYASAIAEYLAFFTAIYVVRPYINLDWAKLYRRVTTPQISLSGMYIDLFIRTLMLQSIVLFFIRYSAQIGPDILAVNGILFQIAVFTFYGMDGIAHSAEMLTGAAFGKKDIKEFNYYCRQCLLWGLVLAIGLSIVLYIGRDLILALLTNLDQIINILHRYYLWLVILPVTSVACFIYDGIFIGTSETRIMRNMMVLTLLLFILLVAIFTPIWGNDGLWFCYHMSMISRALLLAYYMPKVRSDMLLA